MCLFGFTSAYASMHIKLNDAKVIMNDWNTTEYHPIIPNITTIYILNVPEHPQHIKIVQFPPINCTVKPLTYAYQIGFTYKITDVITTPWTIVSENLGHQGRVDICSLETRPNKASTYQSLTSTAQKI